MTHPAHIAISALSVHPSYCFPDGSDEDQSALVKSISDLGFIYPLKVCKGVVVDGVRRLRAAKTLSLVTVPAEEIDSADIASVMLHGLLARTHLTKSARAYLSVPLLENAVIESRRRATEAAKSFASASKSSPQSKLPALCSATSAELAESLGISRSLVFSARDLRKKFASHPDLKATWESKILSGEMSVGEAQQAIAGKIAAIQGKTTPKGDAYQLTLDLFGTAAVRFERWGKLEKAQRTEVADKFRKEFLPNLPEDLLREVEEFVEERKSIA